MVYFARDMTTEEYIMPYTVTAGNYISANFRNQHKNINFDNYWQSCKFYLFNFMLYLLFF